MEFPIKDELELDKDIDPGMSRRQMLLANADASTLDAVVVGAGLARLVRKSSLGTAFLGDGE